MAAKPVIFITFLAKSLAFIHFTQLKAMRLVGVYIFCNIAEHDRDMMCMTSHTGHLKKYGNFANALIANGECTGHH